MFVGTTYGDVRTAIGLETNAHDFPFRGVPLNGALYLDTNLTDQLMTLMEQKGLDTNDFDLIVEKSRMIEPDVMLRELIQLKHEIEDPLTERNYEFETL